MRSASPIVTRTPNKNAKMLAPTNIWGQVRKAVPSNMIRERFGLYDRSSRVEFSLRDGYNGHNTIPAARKAMRAMMAIRSEYGSWVLTWSTWSHAADMEEIIEVSDSGEA